MSPSSSTSSSDGDEPADRGGLLVGFHRGRHFGGPGRLRIEPGELTLTDRRGRHAVRHAGDVVRLERKRFEPPGTNWWLTVDDGERTVWATMSRPRAERVAELLTASGFTVDRGTTLQA